MTAQGSCPMELIPEFSSMPPRTSLTVMHWWDFLGETDLLAVSGGFPSSHSCVPNLSVQGEGIISVNYDDPGSTACTRQCVKESHRRVRSVTLGIGPRGTLTLQGLCTSPVISILSQQSRITIKMEMATFDVLENCLITSKKCWQLTMIKKKFAKQNVSIFSFLQKQLYTSDKRAKS